MIALRLGVGGLLLVMIHRRLLVVRSAVLLETGLRQYRIAVDVAAAATDRCLTPIHHPQRPRALMDVVGIHHRRCSWRGTSCRCRRRH
uniref:Putative secreted protein n=1 Tax=Anopheles marajoara TaxID=58244 RepID=A0A2M4CA82_9DIPT